MLQQYLEVLETMINRPEKASVRIRELWLIVENVHYVLNRTRTHKAEEVLLHILQMQNQQRIDAIQHLEEQKKALLDILARLAAIAEESEPEMMEEEWNGQVGGTKESQPNSQQEYYQDLSLLRGVLQQIQKA
jgi:hypothetical protein